MRTRLLAATLTALATVGLAACSSSGSGTSGASPTSAAATVATSSATPAGTPGTGAPTAAPTPAPSTAAPTTAPGTSAPTPAETPAPPKPAPPSDAGLPTKPDADVTAKVVAALNAVDPAIVGGNPEQAIDRARSQCQAMYQFPKDRAKLVELADQRFTSPDHPQGFGTEKAEKIVDALRATLCPAR